MSQYPIQNKDMHVHVKIRSIQSIYSKYTQIMLFIYYWYKHKQPQHTLSEKNEQCIHAQTTVEHKDNV